MRQGRDWANDEFLFFYLARRCRRRPGRVLPAAAASSPPVGPGPLGRHSRLKKKKKKNSPPPFPPLANTGVKKQHKTFSFSLLLNRFSPVLSPFRTVFRTFQNSSFHCGS